ncbi:unnamed protein product [Closterium sp. Naga37s-1]|nr:unnamed protein product [Closterium sp. Naga37s-1]
MAAWSAGVTTDLLARALSPAAENGASRCLGIADRRSPPSCRPSSTSPPIPTAALFSPGARDSPSVSCLVSFRPPLSRVRAISASSASASDTDGPDLSPRPSLPDPTPRAVLDFPPAEGFGEELTKLLTMLPEKVRDVLQRHPAVHSLVEVVLDLGRRPVARFPVGDVFVSHTACSLQAPSVQAPLTSPPPAYPFFSARRHSPSHPLPFPFPLPSPLVTSSPHSLPPPSLSPPFRSAQVGEFGADNRAGIDRTLHRISAIRNRAGRIIGLTCRVGRAISGSAEMVRDLVAGGESVLLMGAPGVGKTTAIREVARILADECARRVVVVDTSNEIAGDGDIAHAAIGSARRMQVPHVELQHQVMIEAVENHMPQVVIIDEIGSELEAAAAATIAQRGVQLIATAHGRSVENLVKNPHLHTLAGGVQTVTLGDEEARRRGVQKSVMERGGPPVFQAAVEMHSRGRWSVHRNLAATVDALLSGKAPQVEVREMGQHGEVWVDGDAATRSDNSTLLFLYQVSEEHVEQVVEVMGLASLLALLTGIISLQIHFSSLPWFPCAQVSEEHVEQVVEVMGLASLLALLTGIISLQIHFSSLPWFPCAQVSEEHVEQVVEVMGLAPLITLTTDIAAADAVLALRSKLKGNAWLRGVAKFRHLPIYAVKANTASQVVRALRAILNLPTLASPPPSTSSFSTSTPLSSPAATLSRDAPLPGVATASATPPNQLSTLQDESSKGGGRSSSGDSWVGGVGEDEETMRGAHGGSLEDEIDALEVSAMGWEREHVLSKDRPFVTLFFVTLFFVFSAFPSYPPVPVVPSNPQEARMAAESMMGSAAQAVDLLPRAPRILSLQLQLINDYPLSWQYAGSSATRRIRILPLPASARSELAPAARSELTPAVTGRSDHPVGAIGSVVDPSAAIGGESGGWQGEEGGEEMVGREGGVELRGGCVVENAAAAGWTVVSLPRKGLIATLLHRRLPSLAPP